MTNLKIFRLFTSLSTLKLVQKARREAGLSDFFSKGIDKI